MLERAEYKNGPPSAEFVLALSQDRDYWKQQHAAAQDTIADLQGQVRDLNGESDGLAKLVATLDTELTTVKQRVAQLESNRDKPIEQVDPRYWDLNELRANNRLKADHITELCDQLTTLQADHATLLGLVQALPVCQPGLWNGDDGPGRKHYRLTAAYCDDNGYQELMMPLIPLLQYRASLPSQPAQSQGGANGNTEQALEFAVRALRSAQPIVCSASCPSVKRTGEEWAHRQPCDSLTLTLRTVESYLPKKVEHVCGAQGFGQSLDDQCSACEQNKPNAEGETRA